MSGVADIVSMEEARSKRASLKAADFNSAGDMLRAAREALDLSLEDVSTATNIKPAHLQSIEAMALDQLPPAPYTTGFVKAYATHVELPVDLLVARFRDEAGYGHSGIAPKIEIRQAEDMGPAREMSLIAVIAIILFILWAAWQVTRPAQNTGPVELEGLPITERPSDPPQQTYEVSNDLPASVLTDRNIALAETVRAAALESVATPAGESTVSDEAATDSSVATAPIATTIETPIQSNQPETSPEAVSEISAEMQRNSDFLNALEAASPSAPELSGETPVSDEVISEMLTEEIAGSAVEMAPEADFQPLPVIEPVMVAAVPLDRIAPIYPKRCNRRAADNEKVTVSYDIAANGRVVNARILSSTNSCFDRSALNAINRWRFTPASRDGVPIASNGKATNFSFALE
jgi:TonB family protein